MRRWKSELEVRESAYRRGRTPKYGGHGVKIPPYNGWNIDRMSREEFPMARRRGDRLERD